MARQVLGIRRLCRAMTFTTERRERQEFPLVTITMLLQRQVGEALDAHIELL